MYRIADAHCDFLAYQTLGDCGGRIHDQMSFSDLTAGGVALQNFAVWVPVENEDKKRDYTNQVSFLNDFTAQHGEAIKFVKSKVDLQERAQINAVLSIESADSINCRLENIDTAYNAGARILSLTWNDENEFAHGAHSSGGIKKQGLEAVKILNRLRMALDVSHLNEEGFWEAAGIYEHPVCATHSCVYELCDNPRNLKKDQIRHIINSGGFIGVNFYPLFLTGCEQAKISDILRHIDYILDLDGENSVGFGSDFCGIDYTPKELMSPADFQKLPEAMELNGYSNELIYKICYSNLERFILKFL